MTEERKIEMPYGVEVAYHCQRCGAPVAAYGKCYYCGSEEKLRYEPTSDLQFYIELDGEKKFYFNHITEMGEVDFKESQIDVTALGDDKRIFVGIGNIPDFSFAFNATDDGLYKANMMEEAKLITFNITMKKLPKVARFRVEDFRLGMPEVEQNTAFKFRPRMQIHDFDGWVNPYLTAPDNARCPNCGAIVRKAYGVCDYCGGWVEYK